MFNGKLKAITFSYDDGVSQDVRLIELFNKYNLKATFNLNSDLLGKGGELVREGVTVSHIKNKIEDVKSIYEGHEIAAHTLTHPLLTKESDESIIKQVENDRIALSEIAGYEVKGFAYPGGGVNFDERVANVIRENTGIKYCRTTVSTNNFNLQDDLYTFKPTVYHHVEFDKMIELGQKFLQLKPTTPQIFYIWGHSYEFDIHNDWARFEEFLKTISGKDDIFYGTNSQVLLNNKT